MLSCENLTVSRAGTIILRDISFNVGKGGVLVLSGPNGSGKSSLLRALAGLIPISGKIAWKDEPIKNLRDMQHFVGHAAGIAETMTVLENLALWGKLHGTALAVPAAMHYFELLPYLNTPTGKLSAGFRRRVALARLLAAPMPVWLLDEPMSHLDTETQKRVVEMIGAHTHEGGVVVMASHEGHENIKDVQVLDMKRFQC